LEALPVGGRGPSSVFRLGIDCDRSAIEHHGGKLGPVMGDRISLPVSCTSLRIAFTIPAQP
jgi:hypothetical protein